MKTCTRNVGLPSSRPRWIAVLAIAVLTAVALPATATASNHHAFASGQEHEEELFLDREDIDRAGQENDAPSDSVDRLDARISAIGCTLPEGGDQTAAVAMSECLHREFSRLESSAVADAVASASEGTGRAPRGPIGPDDPPPPPPPPPSSTICNGLAASAGFIGSAGADDFTLDFDVAEVVWTGAGPDTVRNVGPGDTVCTGPGEDLVLGSVVDAPSASALGAYIDGGPDDDGIVGTRFADTILGGGGDDIFTPQHGNDTILGGDGNDTMHSPFGGNLVVDGGDGHDTIKAWGTWSSVLNGGDGNDTIYASRHWSTTSILDGGDGEDYLYGHLINYPGDGGENNHYFGGDGVDHIRGTQWVDWIWGDDGDDRIDGRDGEDHIYGGYGSDTIQGGGDRDKIWAGEDPDGSDWDVVDGGGGNDKCREAEKKYNC